MKILAIETTCDETAAAILSEDLTIHASVVASQEDLHEQYSGVVPEIAARAHVERILPVIHDTVQKSGMTMSDLDAIAVAHTPGLSGSLLVGLTAAKALAFSLDKPLVAINHLHAHVYACQLDSGQPVFPCIGMIVSGGHTHLYEYPDALNPKFLGGTIDDAAGEAFDKVASMLKLRYPGGPEISKLAESGNPKAHAYPRSFIKDAARLDFSFSGLKTAVRYSMTGPGNIDPMSIELTPQQAADIAASFQQAVVDCLVTKALQAVRQTGIQRLCVGGGVAANRVFRDQLESACVANEVELFIAPMKYCTDNAVMGAIAFERIKAGQFDSLDVDIKPGLVRM